VIDGQPGFADQLPGGVEGLFVKLAGPELLEAASSHFDFCVVDIEHSSLGEAEAFDLLRCARLLGFPALVRLTAPDPALINRALEAGATGVQLSNVRRKNDILSARAAMAFPPAGHRSASTAHAAARFGATALRDYVDEAPRAMLVAQIEDLDTDDPLEEILLAGVDVAFIGTSDLTVAARFDANAVAQRVEDVARAAHAARVTLGGFRLNHPASRYEISCSDVSLFTDALTSHARRVPRRPRAATWDELPAEAVRPGVSRCAFGTEACQLVMNTCQPGMELRPHSHSFDQIALITSGHGRYHVGETAHDVGPGSVLLVPAGVTHFIETVHETMENIDVFAPARGDYLHLLAWMRDEPRTADDAR
jgi:2-keto-3-deoxy-L-rhamnonate aldolase RhmA/quercetin dioxygenase-like cupin family protein